LTAEAFSIPGREQRFHFLLQNVHTGCGSGLAIYLHSTFPEIRRAEASS